MQSVLITISEILRETAQELEKLGSDLCADPMIVREHCTALQAVDVMVQRHHGLASVLEAQCAQGEIERMTLEALRDRLRLRTEPGDPELLADPPQPAEDAEWWGIADDSAPAAADGGSAGSAKLPPPALGPRRSVL